MKKIAITGKANSGKNTLSKLIHAEMNDISTFGNVSVEYIAFADPIKEMAKLMFPHLPKKHLFGSSKYRALPIPGAFKNGQPLTVRQLLIDLGTGVGREYNETTWLDAFDHRFKKAESQKKDLVIVTDVRFRNEFNHLKKMGFYQIRLTRDLQLKIDHSSETNQDSIKDEEFDYIINNNGTLQDLQTKVEEIVNELRSK